MFGIIKGQKYDVFVYFGNEIGMKSFAGRVMESPGCLFMMMMF